MDVKMRRYQEEDLSQALNIWNQVVEEGMTFPQMEEMAPEEAHAFFEQQSYTGVAYDEETGEILGLYILHPNNVGRCGHIANASYAVRPDMRRRHIGELLVKSSLKKGAQLGFRILQFNAVTAKNTAARKLYEQLGFTEIGRIPGGFMNKKEEYEEIVLYYHEL